MSQPTTQATTQANSQMAKPTPSILFDTNILMDSFTKRAPFYPSADTLISLVEYQKIRGVLCANTVTTLHYLFARYVHKAFATEQMEIILSLFDIAPVNRAVLMQAHHASAPDFEDAVIFCSASHANVDAIVTRNVKDFGQSSVPVYGLEEAVAWLVSLS